jgi:hypothetical protein
MKSAKLLTVGFGQAGAKLIAENMVNDQIRPLIQGNKINGIFVFILIESFE